MNRRNLLKILPAAAIAIPAAAVSPERKLVSRMKEVTGDMPFDADLVGELNRRIEAMDRMPDQIKFDQSSDSKGIAIYFDAATGNTHLLNFRATQ